MTVGWGKEKKDEKQGLDLVGKDMSVPHGVRVVTGPRDPKQAPR